MQLHTPRRTAAAGWTHTIRSWMPGAAATDWRSGRPTSASVAPTHKRKALAAAAAVLLLLLLCFFLFASSPSARFPAITARRPWIVHLVPHSHLDAGWLTTFEDYYRLSGGPILSAVLRGLATKVERRFSWADMAFLLRWMDEQAHQAVPWLAGKTVAQCRALVNPAVSRCLCASPTADPDHRLRPTNLLLVACLVLHPPAQLAVLGGSYVAMDEALVSPLEALECFTLGRGSWRQWVARMQGEMRAQMEEADAASALRTSPRGLQLGWNIDQFGHAASTPLIMRGVGITALVAGRTLVPEHQRMKRERSREFQWTHTQASLISSSHSSEPIAASSSSDDASAWGAPAASVFPPPVLTSILAEHYSSPVSLKFLHLQAFNLSTPAAACASTAEASAAAGRWVAPGLVETLEGLFSYLHSRLAQQQSRHILVLVGDDFRFQSDAEVASLYNNLAWIRRGCNQMERTSSTNTQAGAGAGDFDDDEPANNVRALVGPRGWARIQAAKGDQPMHVRVSNGVDYIAALRIEEQQHWRSKERGAGPGLFPPYPLAPPSLSADGSSGPAVQRPLTTQTDLFPYSDLWFDNEWSGYYGNVPFLKAYVKRVLSRARAVKTLAASAFLCRGIELTLPPEEMELAERQTQLLLHHDAITGTHRAHVHKDYMQQAYEAEQSLHAMLAVFAAELQRASQPPTTSTTPTPQDPSPSFARFNSSAYDDHRISLAGPSGDAAAPAGSAAAAAAAVFDVAERKAIVDVTSLLSQGDAAAAQGKHISIQLFNPLAEAVVQAMELRIEVGCEAWIKYAQEIGAAFPALRVWDPLNNRMLRTQSALLDSRESLLAQCVSSSSAAGSAPGSPHPVAAFDLHVEVRFAALEIKSLHILCASGAEAQRQAETETTARDQADLVRWTEGGSGVWLRGARLHALIYFDADDQQLSYTLTRRSTSGNDDPASADEALSFHHTHGFYLSSTRVPANSGAYLFRSLFPSAFFLALLPLATGWGCAIAAWACVWILARFLARRAPWIRVLAKRISSSRIDCCETPLVPAGSKAMLPGLHSHGKKQGGGALQTVLYVLGLVGRLSRHLLGRVASNPVLLHAGMGLKLGSAVVFALVGASSHVGPDLVRFLLSPQSDRSLFRGGLCAGAVQGTLLALSVVVRARRDAEQERQRKKARENEDGEERSPLVASSAAAPPTSTWRALSLPLAVLAFAISFVGMCCFLFMAFPSMQVRVFSPSSVSEPRYALTAQGPLFSEVSYMLSPDVWQSIRVYSLEDGSSSAAAGGGFAAPASSSATQSQAWQNEVVQYAWSVAPCRNCQLVTRIRHDPVHAPAQPPPRVATEPDLAPDTAHAPPEDLLSIPSRRALLPFGRWARAAARAVRDLLRGLSSAEFHRFFTDDGLSLVRRSAQGFSPFLASKIFPLNGVASVLESEATGSTEGFSLLAGNQGFGVTRMRGALELLFQRWLTVDDEKGLDAGIEDSRRYRLRVHLQPKWRGQSTEQHAQAQVQTTRAHVISARTIQRRVTQQPFAFDVSAPRLAAAAAISPSDSSLESAASDSNLGSVTLLSMQLLTGSSSLPSPPPLLPAQSASCRSGDTARLLALRVMAHASAASSVPLRWSRDQLCSWLRAHVPSDSAGWTLACLAWSPAVSLSFEPIVVEADDDHAAPPDELVMHAEQPAAVIVWVQRTTCKGE